MQSKFTLCMPKLSAPNNTLARNIAASIGVGGNFSGPEAVYEALRVDEAASKASEGRGAKLRFCANVDPVDFHLCTRDFDPGETLVIITQRHPRGALVAESACLLPHVPRRCRRRLNQLHSIY